ncbi:MAG: beta-galactosidase [Massiliimalia sp.]|jgi:beta-galactosidase
MEYTVIQVQNPQNPPAPIPMGGKRQDGTVLGVNQRYFEKNHQPVIPVMGEFHFSRYPAEEWETALEMMQAGGVEIVATYVFWIHHEERRGEWDFSDCRNLRRFLETCQRVAMPVVLRIGPWCHGECRNGGFPDWLVHLPNIQPRTDDPQYLSCVRKLYEKIYQQAEGMFWQDGGPVIGVQIENELTIIDHHEHSLGIEHLKTLKSMAQEIGFQVPFYTVTGWGAACVPEEGFLPLQAAYVDAPWDSGIEELPPSPNFLIGGYRNADQVGNDLFGSSSVFTYDETRFPYATAELGGGMQVTHHRRVVAFPEDTQAMTLCYLASGANLIGYYMYHGGVNPKGKDSTLQESVESGYPNDVPVKSYDFQAPLGENGEVRESFRRLKQIHMLLKEWGGVLAPAQVFLAEENPTDAGDLEHLRASVRHNWETGGGFLFVNNHQRKRVMKSHQKVCFQVKTPKEEIQFPPMSIPDGRMGIFPYGLSLGEHRLRCANAQPLCRLGDRYFFFTDETPEYVWEGTPAEVVTLTEEQARNSWKLGEQLYLTGGQLRQHQGKVWLQTTNSHETVTVYGAQGEPKTLFCQFQPVEINVQWSQIGKTKQWVDYAIYLDSVPAERVSEVFLQLDFLGDQAQLFLEEELVADWYSCGLPWRVALKRLGYCQDYRVRVYASQTDIYFDLPQKPGMELCGVQVIPQYAKCL